MCLVKTGTQSSTNLSDTKTKEMVICFCTDHVNVPKIKIDGDKINGVKTTKVLGRQ